MPLPITRNDLDSWRTRVDAMPYEDRVRYTELLDVFEAEVSAANRVEALVEAFEDLNAEAAKGRKLLEGKKPPAWRDQYESLIDFIFATLGDVDAAMHPTKPKEKKA